MAKKVDMAYAPGTANLDPSVFFSDRDIRDIQVGATNASGEGTHNRLAVPWAGAAYTFVDGSLVKVAGRDGAMEGPELERKYSNLVGVWQSFAQAQKARDNEPGSYDALRADLGRVANRISSQGRMAEDEGRSLRAMKLQRQKGQATRPALEAADVNGS